MENLSDVGITQTSERLNGKATSTTTRNTASKRLLSQIKTSGSVNSSMGFTMEKEQHGTHMEPRPTESTITGLPQGHILSKASKFPLKMHSIR